MKLFLGPVIPLLCAALGVAAESDMDLSREFSMGLLRRSGSPANLQTFTDALGGVVAPPITASTDSSRPFEVSNDTFTDFASAASRSCSDQHNSCADQANSGKQFSVGDCDTQQTSCNDAVATATQTAFPTLTSSNADFDFFCDP